VADQLDPGGANPTESGAHGRSASKAVLGRGLLYTVGTAAPVLSNAVITPFVTRLLGPVDYGVVATALVVMQVGMIVAGLGLGAAITRHGILEESGVEGARSLVHRGALASLLVAGLACFCVQPLGRLVGIDDDTALLLAFVAAAGFSVVVNVQAYLRVLDRPLPFVLLSLGAALGGPALGMALLLRGDGTSAEYLGGLAAGYALTALAGLALTLQPSRHVRGDTRRALRVGLPTVPHQVALYLAGGALVLVAGHLYGTADAGRLQLAVLIGSAPGVVTASLNNAWAPVVYRTPDQHRGEVLEHTSRDIAAIAGLAAGFVAFLSPALLRIAAPSTYDPTPLTPAVGIVAIGTVLSVFYLANVHLVFASGRSAGLAVVTPVALLVGVGAAWLAGAAISLTAISLGMTVTYAVMAAGVAGLARRVSPTRWHESRLVLPLGAGILLCVLGAAAPAVGPWLVVRWVGAAVLAGLSLLVLRRVLTR
jgi:O-antigen/teichoic acid export membrane protein